MISVDKDDVKFVQQRSNGDCTTACLAMFTGKTYEEIVEAEKEK